jgi:hypothetical protein
VPGTDGNFWSNFIVAGGVPRCLSASGVPPLFKEGNIDFAKIGIYFETNVKKSKKIKNLRI